MASTAPIKKTARAYAYWFPIGLEKQFATGALSVAVLTIFWKSIGLSWIPVFGPNWDKVYIAQPKGWDVAQYPRRTEDEQFWNRFYFFSYGLFGTLGQYCAYAIANSPVPAEASAVATNAMIRNARVFGMFHVAMAIHHLRWAWNPTNGKLRIEEWNIPYPTLQAAALSAWVGWHALKLVLAKKGVTTVLDIRRRSAMINTTTVIVGSVAFGFVIENVMGLRNATYEAISEELILGGPLLMLAFDAFVMRKF